MRLSALHFLFALLPVTQAYATDEVLRYDGVYVSDPSPSGDAEGADSYCEYLRFYPSGTVIAVSSECGNDALPEIKKWFKAKNAGAMHSGVSSGRVTLKGQSIRFVATSKEGKVSYKGTIADGKISLTYHSEINDAEGTENYSFAPW